jgi:hypothetical protein
VRSISTNGEVAVRLKAVSPRGKERIVEMGDPIYADEELKVDMVPFWPEGTRRLYGNYK